MFAKELGVKWYDLFSRYASDLYPGLYTRDYCIELAGQAMEIKELAKEKESTIVAHNYLLPEFHEIADFVGDSLGLSLKVKTIKAKRVDFESVFFMGATAKIITGDETKVYVCDKPEVLGCSLVFGTDHGWLENWRKENPEGVIITYINSDAYTKSLSHFISTSRNTDKIIAYALKNYPGSRILVMPDKYLGFVMKQRALKILESEGVKADPTLVEIYKEEYNGQRAACYVHEQLGPDETEIAMLEHPGWELMIHPECGCASSCLMKLEEGKIPQDKAYFLSTEQMVEHAKKSSGKKFLVATEKGMIYRLRKEMPDKEFLPVSMQAQCKYMKSNIFPKLLDSLKNNRLEIVFCNDCCDPKKPHESDWEIHLQKSVAEKASMAIRRMLMFR
ncbi:MAG: quinolinate synthase NadA [Patescibacteria group bacterium]